MFFVLILRQYRKDRNLVKSMDNFIFVSFFLLKNESKFSLRCSASNAFRAQIKIILLSTILMWESVLINKYILYLISMLCEQNTL